MSKTRVFGPGAAAAGRPRSFPRPVLASCWLLALMLAPLSVWAAAVNVVFFYAPNAQSSLQTMSGVLAPLAQRYGEQLVIVPVDVRRRGGQKVFREAQRRYHLAGKAGLVPVVVVGNEALSGKQAIAAGLPALLARLVAGEGAPLPPLAGLQQVIEGTADQTAVAAGGGGVVGVLSRMGERFNADRVGNGLAVGVLLVMLAILLQTLARLGRAAGPGVGARPGWAVLPVALAGVGVSAYLAFVETTGTSAICGPVGNCNTVQQSIYSHIFGVPLGVAGTIGYLLIALSWVMARRERPSARLASVALLALSLAGMGFSIYLTFLEPFVIGATCVWCLGSASLMTLLVLLTRGPGAAVLRCEV